MQEIKQWFSKYFGHAENILFVLLVIFSIAVLWFFGSVIAPFLASLVLAYLLNSSTNFLVKTCKIKRGLAILLLFAVFAGLLFLVYTKLIPMISNQITLFISQIPKLLGHGYAYLQTLPQKYPRFISGDMIAKITDPSALKLDSLPQLGRLIPSSLNSLSNIFEWLIYLFLIPVITFLLLKDKNKFRDHIRQTFPKPKGVMLRIGQEAKLKLGRYLQGVIAEATIVGVIYTVIFFMLKLNYALLLGVMGGVIVFLPIVGTLLMTIPLVIVGLFQFGLSSPFWLLMGAYVLVHIFDSYLLVPVLFGRTLALHPLTIILALIVFGGILGFWGLIFAIPLATFISIVIDAYREYGAMAVGKKVSYDFC